MKGLLITLEGIDGSGKSSVAGFLAESLPQIMPERGFVFTAEPTRGEAGKMLRTRLSRSYGQGETAKARKMEELFLFMADHAEHLASTVLPSMEKELIVVSDRYSDSTAAYQGVTLKGIVPDPLCWIREISCSWNVAPHLTILFALDPDLALKRLSARADKEKFERQEFLKEVDGNFRRLASLEPGRFALVDASFDMEKVAHEALSLILDLIKRT